MSDRLNSEENSPPKLVKESQNLEPFQTRIQELEAKNRQLEEKLLQSQESEERWQLALHANNDGIWDWNLKTNKIFYSERWKTMLGYEDWEIANNHDEWTKRVHPEDL